MLQQAREIKVTMKKIILASSSPRRRELLGLTGLEFQVITSEAEEITNEKNPKDIVKELSAIKAKAVYNKLLAEKKALIDARKAEDNDDDSNHNLSSGENVDISDGKEEQDSAFDKLDIIAKDAIISHKGRIIGNPQTDADAKDILQKMVSRAMKIADDNEDNEEAAGTENEEAGSEKDGNSGSDRDDVCSRRDMAEARKELENYIIIGADTIVSYKGEILGKPKDRTEARRMIRSFAGDVHQVYTGVTLINGDRIDTFAAKTDVYVYDMTDEEIGHYVDLGESDDKAGAYGIQGRFAVYVKKIEGDYNNVVGLPVAKLMRHLNKMLSDGSES